MTKEEKDYEFGPEWKPVLSEFEQLRRKWREEDEKKAILEQNKELNSDLNLESILNQFQNESQNKNQNQFSNEFQDKSRIKSEIKLLEINLEVAQKELDYWWERYQKLFKELSEIKSKEI